MIQKNRFLFVFPLKICSATLKFAIRNAQSAILVVALLFALCLSAEAQQAVKVPRIGLLRVGSPPDPFVEAFREGLWNLGYVEGKSIVIEYRWGEGKPEQLSALATDLVRLGVDVIVPGGNTATRAVQKATSTIPIVMSGTTDPVASGFVASLARPGGNITGSATLFQDLAAKRLELLRESFPKVSRVGVLYNRAVNAAELRETQDTGRTLGVEVKVLEVRDAKDFDGAFEAGKTGRIGAITALASAFFYAHRTQIVDLAAKSRLPAIYEHREFVEVGGLMSYGPNFRDLFRRAATYVDRILKGAKPADLPVEQPTKFELVINLKTVKQIGLTIPPNVLARADRVIK
jgi:putative ABC transport system substrate-binding protein